MPVIYVILNVVEYMAAEYINAIENLKEWSKRMFPYRIFGNERHFFRISNYRFSHLHRAFLREEQSMAKFLPISEVKETE